MEHESQTQDIMNETEIKYLLEQISNHTNVWDGWTLMLSVLTMLASLVTIIGLGKICIEYQKHKASKKRQELIVKDIDRHLFINAAIMEVVRMKMVGNWDKMHPTEGVFTRFCVLDTDLQLDKIRVKDKNYTRLHSASLTLRNYNIMSQVAEAHFNDPLFDPREKICDLDELWKRTKRVTEKLLALGNATKLKINRTSVQQFIINYYDELKKERAENWPKEKLEERIKREQEIHPISRYGVRTYFDCIFDLRETFDFCVKTKYDEIQIIPFIKDCYITVSTRNL